MTMMPTLKERLWGSLAHVPLITIIWASYFIYKHFANSNSLASIPAVWLSNFSKLPVTPIILTLMSLPISITIMHLKRTSPFIRQNALEAFFFNIWLLKNYGTFFIGAVIGVTTHIKIFIWVAGILGLIISLFCLQQSITGIITAFGGTVYRYLYPFRKRL